MAPIPPRQQQTVDAIYASYVAKADNGFREHLGGSLIGDSCERSLWYSFHWTTKSDFSGRMLRLFDTGNLEENRLVKDLRNIGVTVMSVDPNNGQQWRVRDETGHFGGSMDGVCLGLPEAPKTWHLLEFKTHSLKSFASLKKDGVQKSKPKHWAQMQTYMHLAHIERAMYLAVCKDTDEIYQERIHADPAEGIRLVAKAARIINSPRPLERIANTETWHECRFCDHHAACWRNEPPDRHCRSCMHSTPIADGKWSCEKHGKALSLGEQKAGCVDHRFIPDFVAGEQFDAADDGSWISYRRADGTVWNDEGK